MIHETLRRVFGRIKLNYKSYILVVIQITTAVIILNLMLCMLFTIKANKDKLKKDGANKEFVVKALVINNEVEFNASNNPFDKELLFEAKKECGDNVDVNINVLKYLAYFGEKAKVVNDIIPFIDIVFTSEYENVKMTKDFYEQALDFNEGNTANLNYFNLTLKDNLAISSITNKTYTIEFIESENDIAYVPIEEYYPLYNSEDLFNTKLVYHINNVETDFNKIILDSYLSMEKENYIYHINSEFTDYLNLTHDLIQLGVRYSFFTIVGTIIFSIGLCGLFILIIFNRSREISIYYALGQTKRKIISEILVELFILILLGLIIGIFVSKFKIDKGFTFLIKIDFQWMAVLITSAISLCSIIIPIVFIVILIKKMMPNDILRSL